MPGTRLLNTSSDTAALAVEISKSSEVRSNPVDLSRGRYGGTYVHEDLAIDYAAWVSLTFKLEIYRAFKERRTERQPPLRPEAAVNPLRAY